MGKIASLNFLACFWACAWISLQTPASAAGLSCHRCVSHVCDHKYCNLTLDAFTNAGGVDKSLPLCESGDWASERNSTVPDDLEQCQGKELCGHTVFKLTTSYTVVEGKNPSTTTSSLNQIPVFIQVDHRLNSSVHVFGCLDRSQLACPLYPTTDIAIDIVEAGKSVRGNSLTVANKASSCCRCTENSCNKNQEEEAFGKHCSTLTQSLVVESWDKDKNEIGQAGTGASMHVSFNHVLVAVGLLVMTMKI